MQQVLSKADIFGSEIDLITDFTSILQDYIGPTWSTAGFIQKEINAHRASCTAITVGGCSSYHFALEAAGAMISAEDNINRVLLFAGYRMPNYNKTYYPIAVSSDGGSALILRKNWGRAVILAIDIISVGRLHDVWFVPGLGNQQNDGQINLEKLLHMHCVMKKFNDGVRLKNFTMFNRRIEEILKKAGKENQDIDMFVYPTFSTWDQNYFCESTGIPREKEYTQKLRERGHVQESDMIINYVDALSEGLIKNGNFVMVLTNGACFAWIAAIMRH